MISTYYKHNWIQSIVTPNGPICIDQIDSLNLHFLSNGIKWVLKQINSIKQKNQPTLSIHDETSSLVTTGLSVNMHNICILSFFYFYVLNGKYLIGDAASLYFLVCNPNFV